MLTSSLNDWDISSPTPQGAAEKLTDIQEIHESSFPVYLFVMLLSSGWVLLLHGNSLQT